MKTFLPLACAFLSGTLAPYGLTSEANRATIPACMIVDDPAPFFNCYWVNHKTSCREIPTSFYVELGRWAEKEKIKGKFSVVPCLGGIKPIDGSLGEYPGHTRGERLEWIEMVKTLYVPRFTITPEVITHNLVWDLKARKLVEGSPRECNWLEVQPVDVQTRYIAEAMQMLKNVGLEPGGLTMCWSYAKEKNAVLGEAALAAAEKVCGLKYIMIFNDTGERPGVIYRRGDGAMAVSLRPNVGDCYDHTLGKKTEADIRADADKYITEDGRKGQFVDAIARHKCLIFYTHAQSLYGNGTKSGFKLFQIAIDRLHRHYGDRIQWMTGLEIAQYFCPPKPEPSRHRAGEPLDLDQTFSTNKIAPRGLYYDAIAPDTLDLAERAKLAIHALTEALNPDSGYGPYGHAFFKVQPAYMTERMYAPNMDAGKANWGKIMEALVLLRSVCGSDLNLSIESQSLKGMIGYVNTVGCPYQCSRVLMTLMELYRENPAPELRQLIERQASRLYNNVHYQDNLAAYEDPGPKLQDSRSGINNYEVQTHQHSGPMWALCQWYDLAGNPKHLELAGKFSRFVSQPKFWEPELEPRFFAGAERGHFKGHIHSYVGALIGILEYAERANDAWLKEFVRNSYEYVRNVGIARIGALGETCTIGDMTVLAAELSRMGVGDYWDHVDQYVRNHLSEMQFVDKDLVQRCVAQMPRLDELPKGPQDADIVHTRQDCVPDKDLTRRMVERNLGTFFSDGGHPAKIPRHNWSYTICCLGNGAKGLYYAWKSIVDCDGKAARINLLLNRASPWLDIDSYLPCQGKVVIRNKTAERLLVRMPLWLDKKAVTSTINGRTAAPFWNGQYAIFDQVKAGDILTMEFPVVDSTETYTLRWNQADCWFESNWAQRGWKTVNEKYICKFRGNTLVEIIPVPATITDGPGYLLYRREYMKAREVPMKTVQRFVMECRRASNGCP